MIFFRVSQPLQICPQTPPPHCPMSVRQAKRHPTAIRESGNVSLAMSAVLVNVFRHTFDKIMMGVKIKKLTR